MTIKKKTAKISLLTIVLAIAFTFPILSVTAKEQEWVLDPIYIDESISGYTWADWAAEPWLKGSGTFEDPYIIKSVVIDGDGSAYGMIIQNSNAHFKIMDSIFYGSNVPYGTGLLLINTYNGIIFKNQFLDNGILLPTEPTGAGISLIDSANNIIEKNTAQRNVGVGIYLDNSDNNVIVDNYVSENTWGILLWDSTFGFESSDDNIIIRNDCVGNFETGIAIGWSHRNTVTKNLCEGNIWGISVGTWASNNKVTQNYLKGNSMGGIIVNADAMYNEIIENEVTENNNGILLINFAMYNVIEDNFVKNNIYGISIGIGASYNEIFENDIIENWGFGIAIWTTNSPDPGYLVWGTSIYHNNIIDNTQQASDDNPWWNDWDGNYWSDYPGIDTDGDGIGDTFLPWPDWNYDYSPYMKKDGWKTAIKIDVVLEPIIIDELIPGLTWADWSAEPWLKGSGTLEDPYMIKNVVIDGDGSINCIAIWNSEAYFKIMKSFFYNTKPLLANERNSGLLLTNTTNGVIFKNQFFNNGWPGEEVGSGIALVGSGNNKIQKNILNDNAAVGIYLENSDNNLVVDNYISGSLWGIMLWDIGDGSSDENTIIKNDVIENIQTGIVIGGGYGNIVAQNLAIGNTWGISIGTWASDNKVTQNYLKGNSMGGIILHDYSMNNEIKGNDCYENQNGIVLINNAMDNKIEDNLFKNNGYGISVQANSYNNEITENDIIENWEIGIVLWDYPWGNIIYHNNIIDNAQQALDINPWSNNWNENYWSDYPGTDIDGDGLGDTDLPWPDWYYDYSPIIEKNGWK